MLSVAAFLREGLARIKVRTHAHLRTRESVQQVSSSQLASEGSCGHTS
jgi:hypothetical protein